MTQEKSNLATEAHGCSWLQLVADILAPPVGVKGPRAVGKNGLDHLAFHTDVAFAHFPQIGNHRHLFAGPHLRYRTLLAIVVMTAGQVPDQVNDAHNSQTR